MTVKELIEKLSKLPPNLKVVVSQSDGGSPLDSIGEAHYRAESTWHGEIKHPDDVQEGDAHVVALYPVN